MSYQADLNLYYSLPEYRNRRHSNPLYEADSSYKKVLNHYLKRTVSWIFSVKPKPLGRSFFGKIIGYIFYFTKVFLVMFFILSKLGLINSSKSISSTSQPSNSGTKSIISKFIPPTVTKANIFNVGHQKNVSRVFAHVNEKMPREYWDWENSTMQYGDNTKYTVLEQIGRGKYSNVFKCKSPEYDYPLVMKIFKPERTRRIRREILILKDLKGGPNIIPLIDVIKDQKDGNPTLVFPYVPNKNWKEEYPTFNKEEIKRWMKEILKALSFSHSKGIMHRDVKPHNVCIDKDTRKIWLIDWGLADFYHVGVMNNVRVASRYYKAPEQLINYQLYDYSLDMWSLGVVFAGMIYKKEFFFKGDSDDDQLFKIMTVLGTKGLKEYIKEYNVNVTKTIAKMLEDHDFEKLSWKVFINERNQEFATPLAIDLLDKLLRYDHQTRITAEEALEHPYFSE